MQRPQLPEIAVAARGALLILLGALAASSLAWGCGQALVDSADLMRRAEEVALFQQRTNPYADPDLTYPPSALPVFAAFLGPLPAKAVKPTWLIVNLLSVGALCGVVDALWGRRQAPWSRGALALWIISCRPVRAGLALGQFHVLPVALVLGAVVAVRAKRSSVAGAFMGLALIKPTMALPVLVWWAVRGHSRAWAAALVVHGALWIGASVWLNASPMRLLGDWLQNARGQLGAGVLDLPSLVSRVWPHFAAHSQLITAALLAYSVLRMMTARRANEFTAAAFALVVACVFTYHRHYDLVLLVPAMAGVLVGAGRRSSGIVRLAAIAAAALMVVPTNPSGMRPVEPFVDVCVVLLAYGLLWIYDRKVGRGSAPRFAPLRLGSSRNAVAQKPCANESCPPRPSFPTTVATARRPWPGG